ncbi:MAG: MurR/RpiR family transcriptional regulator [Chloroflexi bacterium]|nr:MurR/RpiR family transcriptional regulator [Chloroflexota bacterium]
MILERIRQQYPHLTRSQRRLADFIVDSYQDAAFMTAGRLAQSVGVNEATVIRFAQRLGYRGFPEMLEAIQEVVHQDLTPGARLSEEGPAEVPFFAALASQADLLQRAIRQTPPDLVTSLREALGTARQILVVGQGRTAPLVAYLGDALRSLGLPVQSADVGSPGLMALLAAAHSGTAVLGVALDDGDERVARVLTLARRQGARVFALTDSAISPVAQAAERALAVGSSGDDAAPTMAPLVAVIDALAHSLAEEAAEGGAERRRPQPDDVQRVRRFVLSGDDGD